MEKNAREVVVVLGAGRTGSSLLVKALLEMGMSSTGSYAQANEQNPDGFFEDEEILAIHKDLFQEMGIHPMLPVQDELLASPDIRKYRRKLVNLIEDRLEKSKGLVWGFKDPRVSSLIPLWRRVFSMTNVVPKYILTVRDPVSVITSMGRQNDNGDEFSELVWLARNAESIYQTGGNCFIINYEDWFGERAVELINSLAKYVSIDEDYGNEKIKNMLGDIVKSNLNRSQYGESVVLNRYTKSLYAILKNCHGDNFDRKKLMDEVVECRKGMNEFIGWIKFSQRNYKLSLENAKISGNAYDKLQADHKKSNGKLQADYKKSSDKLQADLKKSISQSNGYLKEAKRLNAKLEDMRVKKFEDKKKLLKIRRSSSYLIGEEVVKAFRKPGMNTIKLPYRLLKLALESFFVSRHV